MKKEKNNIKKALYKEKPKAIEIEEISGGGMGSTRNFALYKAKCSLGTVEFHIPYEEMGDKEFEEEISAQLLIRWMI